MLAAVADGAMEEVPVVLAYAVVAVVAAGWDNTVLAAAGMFVDLAEAAV